MRYRPCCVKGSDIAAGPCGVYGWRCPRLNSFHVDSVPLSASHPSMTEPLRTALIYGREIGLLCWLSILKILLLST